jgi:hypothetical protein
MSDYPKAVILVGVLRGLTPQTLTVSAEQKGPGRSVSTSRLDFRRATGFEQATRKPITALGFGQTADAEVRFVNDNSQLLDSAKRNGTRQTIYFGHALGGGGLDAKPVDASDLGRALAKGAPTPITIGCYGGKVPSPQTSRNPQPADPGTLSSDR